MECEDEPRRKAVELVTGELEAAEALAGLAYGGAAFSGKHVAESVMASSWPSDQAEKEARKLRRILTNRESARQTIRRRQAMHMDLTKKAVDLSEENENLKREKEVAVDEYNSLKGRNEVLKAQMAKSKNAEAGEGPHISCSETSNARFFPQNQSSLVPCVWPSILPYTDLRQLQYLSRSNVPNPEIPFVVVPVPWLLNFLPLCSDTNETRNVHQSSTCSSSDTLLHGDNNVQLSSNRNIRAMDMESVHGAGLTLSRSSGDQYTGYNPRGHESKEAFICPPTRNREARRRRKELMGLKNTNDQS